MAETWLKNNRRAMLVAAAPAGLCLVCGAWLANGAITPSWLVRAPAAALAALASWALAAIVWQLSIPRLAYQDGKLLIYARAVGPIRVPVELVEGFLLSKSPIVLGNDRYGTRETSNLVFRIAERASEWERVPVRPLFAGWCGHYVTIRGVWCEPLTVEVANRLNARLDEAKRRAAPTERIDIAKQ